MEAALKKEEWESAAKLAEDVARLEGFWAPGHPYTALHRLRCAKLQNLVGNETAAQVHIMLALVRLVVSHGKGSPWRRRRPTCRPASFIEGGADARRGRVERRRLRLRAGMRPGSVAVELSRGSRPVRTPSYFTVTVRISAALLRRSRRWRAGGRVVLDDRFAFHRLAVTRRGQQVGGGAGAAPTMGAPSCGRMISVRPS